MKGSSQQKVIVVDASAVVVVVNPQHENFVCFLFCKKGTNLVRCTNEGHSRTFGNFECCSVAVRRIVCFMYQIHVFNTIFIFFCFEFLINFKASTDHLVMLYLIKGLLKSHIGILA